MKTSKKVQKKYTNSFFNSDIEKLFEKLVNEKNKGLKNLESIKNELVKKLDFKIDELYKKRDFITEIFVNKTELKLEKISVIRKIFLNSFITNLKYLISMPFIYVLILPTLLFHMFIEIYHQICFRIYHIPLVRSKDYFIFDRTHLPYLNWLEKFNCFYCSYFNCLIAYSREIGGRTEKFWCPIKHAIARKDPHIHYSEFVDYSNGKDFREEWENLRKFKKDTKK